MVTANGHGIFEPDRPNTLTRALPWVAGGALLLALLWFLYTQLTASGVGIAVPAPSPQEVSMLPPPPPPPPPPPEPEEKPPEPTEQPQPSPAEAAKPEPAPQPAPMSMDAAPQTASPDAYGVRSGPSGGMGKPGVCLSPPCGIGPAGGGGVMSVGMYTSYLRSALQERVQDDPRLGRLVFSADYSLSVSPEGRVTGVRFASVRGGSDADMAKLTALLASVRGLDPPPAAMVFPQRVTVRGRKGSF